MENWKDIKGYEGSYQVSDLGRVKSLKRWVDNKGNGGYFVKEVILKSNIKNEPYPIVGLTKNKTRKKFRVHQLVAMAFLNHKPCGHKLVIDHIDNNPLNNNVENLQIVTSRVNTSKDRKGYSSKYVGVHYNDEGINKWRATTSVNGKVVSLGFFDTEERASIAYNFALTQLDKLTEYSITK